MPYGSRPAVSPQASYTRCYCEENIYLLASSFLAIPDFRESWDLSVVFISNSPKTASVLFPPPTPSCLASDDAALGRFSIRVNRLMVEKLHDPYRSPCGANERPVRKGSQSCGIITSFSSSALCSRVGTT